MEAEQLIKFLENCRVDPNEKITTSDDSWWRLKDLIAHAFEVHNDSEVAPKQEQEEKDFQIDFNGNVLAGIKIKNNTPEVYGAMNGYGHGIRISDIKIEEKL